MTDHDHRSSTAHHGGESVVLGAIAVAAYVAFAGFAMFHDGGRARGTALAGVPVDAVRAASQPQTIVDNPTEFASRENPPANPDAGRQTAEPSSLPAVGIPASRSLGAAEVARLNEPSVAAGGVLQFLVRFDEDEAMEWRDRFIENPAATREAFDEFARANSAFTGMRLERMNYSGVATLEFTGPTPGSQAAAQELSRELAGRLNSAEGVDYAEPNLVGWRENSQ